MKPEGIFTFFLVLCSNGKDSSPFSSSSRSPSRRAKSRWEWEPVAKSRWEPVAEENVANNVELPNELAKINICSSLEPTKRMVNLWVGFTFFFIPSILETATLNIAITPSLFLCLNLFLGNKLQSNSWDLRKHVQSRQAPLSQYSHRPTKMQRTGGDASLTENGNASSDSDK